MVVEGEPVVVLVHKLLRAVLLDIQIQVEQVVL